jgi:hypothetical protein
LNSLRTLSYASPNAWATLSLLRDKAISLITGMNLANKDPTLLYKAKGVSVVIPRE